MKSTSFVLLASFCLSAGNIQAEISYDGVGLPAVLNCSSTAFLMNGFRVREKRTSDLYLSNLAIQIKIINAEEVINADKPMSMRLYIVS